MNARLQPCAVSAVNGAHPFFTAEGRDRLRAYTDLAQGTTDRRWEFEYSRHRVWISGDPNQMALVVAYVRARYPADPTAALILGDTLDYDQAIADLAEAMREFPGGLHVHLVIAPGTSPSRPEVDRFFSRLGEWHHDHPELMLTVFSPNPAALRKVFSN